ncbi:MAG: MFS transporter, partial [Inquilinus limosus]|nr:MFS transporter [Inquilinus limosus]
ADRFGRRPTLMVDVLAYSLLEFASGFAPTFTVLLVLRMLYGIAMGGEWGVGASLTMETVPVRSRGLVSGLLQAGYPTGYLLASVVYGLFYDSIGWRGMFMIGVLPALLVLYIRRSVPESPSWTETRTTSVGISLLDTVRRHWRLGIYAILLMTAFNFFSHGTQDIYPTFLKVQHGMGPHEVSLIAIVYNIGAILGGIGCGVLSERFGRRRVIVVAALLALPALPLWAFSSGPVLLAAGAFLMQVAVQGAWGVVPAHLNELSPEEARGTFPGFVYQTGNLLAAINLTLQTHIAVTNGNDYALAMAWVTGVVAVVIALLIAFGPEKRGVAFGAARLRSELPATPAAGK